LFILSDLALNASFPKGSWPGTMKITSSAIRWRILAVSPALLAASHSSTRSRIACSSVFVVVPIMFSQPPFVYPRNTLLKLTVTMPTPGPKVGYGPDNYRGVAFKAYGDVTDRTIYDPPRTRSLRP